MEEIVRISYLIRKAYENLSKDKTCIKTIILYSNRLNQFVTNRNTKTIVNEAYMTVGIAFAIQGMMLKDEARFYNLKKYYVIHSLIYLINGINTYQNTKWKGECAFWAAVDFFHNEIILNDCLCDILVLQEKEISNKNIAILKSYLIESLVRYTINVNFIEKNYTPLYNENNGYSWKRFNDYHLEWVELGNKILREEGPKGADYTLKQEENALSSLSNILNDPKYERLKINR